MDDEIKKVGRPAKKKTAHKLNIVTIITIDENLKGIVPDVKEISYPNFLKAFWKYLKANNLYRNEKIAK